MAHNYFLKFGFGDPRTYTGLAPTMLVFKQSDGTNVTPPAITEISTSGIYTFAWGTTTAIAFLADAATTSPGTNGRYVTGSLQQSDRIDEAGSTLNAIGTTAVALGTTTVAFGTTTVALGTTSVALGTTNVALGTTAVSYGSVIGTTLIAQGSTIVAIGNTLFALGTTNVALGTTNVALGTSNIALGTTAVSYGSIIGTTLIATGVTIVSIGNTSIAIGSTNSQKITNEGTTLIAIGNTLVSFGGTLSFLIGSTASSYGTAVADPVDLFGYLKRIQENLEGNQTFVKSSGVMTIYSRASSVTLIAKTIANSASMVTKL